jgi:DNA-binding MarR family transcriptional regulator
LAASFSNVPRVVGIRVIADVVVAQAGSNEPMIDVYLELIALIERTHRHFLEVVKLELDRLAVHDVNSVQALMLFNIGDAEMAVGELTLRGCYQGANVTYNLKKMVESDYIMQERSAYDRRVSHVRLTEKGRKLRERLQSMHERHVEMLTQRDITEDDLRAVTTMFRQLEALWTGAGSTTARSRVA